MMKEKRLFQRIWCGGFALLASLTGYSDPDPLFLTVKTSSGFCDADSGNAFYGTGILFEESRRRYVLTSEHVLIHSNDESICHEVWNPYLSESKVTNRRHRARIVRVDWFWGLALLELENTQVLDLVIGERREELGDVPSWEELFEPALVDSNADLSGATGHSYGFPFVSAQGGPFDLVDGELMASFPAQSGQVVRALARRGLFPRVPSLYELDQGIGEMGHSGGPVFSSFLSDSERVIGLLSHKYVETSDVRNDDAGILADVLEYENPNQKPVEEEAVVNSQILLAIPSHFIVSWLTSIFSEELLEGSGTEAEVGAIAVRRASSQLVDTQHSAVEVYGLEFEGLAAITEIGGAGDGNGVGGAGDGNGVGGAGDGNGVGGAGDGNGIGGAGDGNGIGGAGDGNGIGGAGESEIGGAGDGNGIGGTASDGACLTFDELLGASDPESEAAPLTKELYSILVSRPAFEDLDASIRTRVTPDREGDPVFLRVDELGRRLDAGSEARLRVPFFMKGGNADYGHDRCGDDKQIFDRCCFRSLYQFFETLGNPNWEPIVEAVNDSDTSPLGQETQVLRSQLANLGAKIETEAVTLLEALSAGRDRYARPEARVQLLRDAITVVRRAQTLGASLKLGGFRVTAEMVNVLRNEPIWNTLFVDSGFNLLATQLRSSISTLEGVLDAPLREDEEQDQDQP